MNEKILICLAENKEETINLLEDFLKTMLDQIYTGNFPEICSKNMSVHEARTSIADRDDIYKKIDEVLDRLSPYIRKYYNCDIFLSNEIRKRRLYEKGLKEKNDGN